MHFELSASDRVTMTNSLSVVHIGRVVAMAVSGQCKLIASNSGLLVSVIDRCPS